MTTTETRPHVVAFYEHVDNSYKLLMHQRNHQTEEVYTPMPEVGPADPKHHVMLAIQAHIGHGMWKGFLESYQNMLKELGNKAKCPICFEDSLLDFAISGRAVSVFYDHCMQTVDGERFDDIYEKELKEHKERAFETGKKLGKECLQNPFFAIEISRYEGNRCTVQDFCDGCKEGYKEAADLLEAAAATKN